MNSDLKQMLFLDAAEAWLASREPFISRKTHHEYKLNIRTLAGFFGKLRLPEIDGDLVRAYQRMRQQKCGAFAINHECNVLCQMRKRIGMALSDYQPLPLPKEERGRVLSPEERERLFRIAQSDPNWEAAYLFAMISVNTSAGPKEVSTLRLKDVDMERAVVRIQPAGAKNAHRVRTIPLNEEAASAVTQALARAKRLGSTSPEHCLFPFRLRGGNVHRALYDVSRCQTSFKTAWLRLRKAAKLEGFRMYDLRHHAITALLENPDVSEQTVEAIAGHINPRMKKRYSHIRIDTMRSALGGCSPVLKQQQSEETLTNQDVIEMLKTDGLPPKIVAEKIGKSKHCHFDTSREALKQLRSTGVSDSVIVAMVRAS